MFDVAVVIRDFSLCFPSWIAGFSAWTSSLGSWGAAGVETRLLFVSCNSAQLVPGWFESGPAVGQWSVATARGVWCLAGCTAECWCCGWMKALAPCCGGEAASTNLLPSCSSSLEALETQQCPRCLERRCHGAVAAWCPPSPLLRLQLFNCGVTFGKGLGLWASS